MRIYLPSTMSGIRAALDPGQIPVRSGVGFAVTAPLRLEYPDWSEEDLEYLAMQDASRASLRLLAAAGDDEPPLRVVIAAEVDDSVGDAAARGRPGSGRGARCRWISRSSRPCTSTVPTPARPSGRPPPSSTPRTSATTTLSSFSVRPKTSIWPGTRRGRSGTSWRKSTRAAERWPRSRQTRETEIPADVIRQPGFSVVQSQRAAPLYEMLGPLGRAVPQDSVLVITRRS